MNILIYTQYFLPETNAPANRWGYFARYLAQQGHQVTVLTSFPNHPQGKILPGYKNQWKKVEKKDGITIIRNWTYITSSRKFLPRLLNYLSFAYSSYRNSRAIKNLDLVIVSSPPLFVALQGRRIARGNKIPFILDLRDMWPEAAVSTGYLRRGLIYSLAERKARQVYREAKRIIVNSPALAEALEDKGVKKEKIVFIPNGVDVSSFIPTLDVSQIGEQYNLRGKFVVLYSGLLGFAQAMGTVIEAANILKEHSDIIFLIVGTGPKAKKLKLQIERKKLNNVILAGAKPHRLIPDFMSWADVCLIPYVNRETFQKNIPSKMYEYMAGGKPIIINLKGEAARIIEKEQAGLVVSADSAQSLAKGILQLFYDPLLRKQMGKKGRNYVMQYRDLKALGRKLENNLQDVIKK